MRQADYAIARLCAAVAKTAASSSTLDVHGGNSRRRSSSSSSQVKEEDSAFLCGGAAANTLTIVTSDNGPQRQWGPYGGSGGPFRGGKFEATEGGLRVFAVFHWPGRILTRKDSACASISGRDSGSSSRNSKNGSSVSLEGGGKEEEQQEAGPIRRGTVASNVEKAGGRTTGVLASLMDLFPTLVHLGRAHLPEHFQASERILLPVINT